MLFLKTSYSFVLDLYFFFSFLLARKKRKRSNQEKEKSRAFFCATIIVAIKQQRLAFIIFIKFALRTVTLGLRRMFEEFLLKNSEFTHAPVTYLYVLTSDQLANLNKNYLGEWFSLAHRFFCHQKKWCDSKKLHKSRKSILNTAFAIFDKL